MTKVLGKADAWLDVAIRWGTLFAVAWGVLTWLAKQMAWLRPLNWADATAIGLSAAMALSIVTSVALIAVRIFRPLTQANLSEDNALAHPELAQSFTDIDGRLERLASRLEELTAKVESMRSQGEGTSAALNELATAVVENRSRSSGSLYAVWVREEAARLEAVITRDATDLYDRLKAGESYDESAWQSWESVHGHWDKALSDWIDVCRFYSPVDLNQRIFSVDENEFSAGWSVSDAQFPSGDAIRRFKRHRIIHQHWGEVLEAIKKNIHLVAFNGMSDDDVRRGALPKSG